MYKETLTFISCHWSGKPAMPFPADFSICHGYTGPAQRSKWIDQIPETQSTGIVESNNMGIMIILKGSRKWSISFLACSSPRSFFPFVNVRLSSTLSFCYFSI
ncbi:hypothetical protein OCU04_001142 [Sclerotinia nivalis]|uniref:Uncharacterized protein n=1 Tax=Sclerotinia nivalis TaxID=352851 RepID=A0A9X0AYP3_9HELO|nr:hypothetical protein OCU04_001142 [Sclerotinia nivalis]